MVKIKENKLSIFSCKRIFISLKYNKRAITGEKSL